MARFLPIWHAEQGSMTLQVALLAFVSFSVASATFSVCEGVMARFGDVVSLLDAISR